MKKYYFAPGRIQDGKLDFNCGRMVIYNNLILAYHNIANDHNDLLRAFASRYKINKDEVISNAIRLYFQKYDDCFIISGVRAIDDSMFQQNIDKFAELIKSEIK